MKEECKKIIEYYQGQGDVSTETVRYLLEEIQEVEGSIDFALKREISKLLGIKIGTIDAIIRHSSNLREGNYKYEVTACTGERCGNKGGSRILAKVRSELGILGTGLSEDGLFLLKTRNCLKECKSSPNMKINDVCFRHLTENKVEQIFSALRKAEEK